MGEDEIKTQGFVWGLGVFASWLRDRWLLSIVGFLAALAVVVVPRLLVDSDGKMLDWVVWPIIVLGSAAAAAVVLDRIADSHKARVAQLENHSQQFITARALRRILPFLEEIHDASFAEGEARVERFVTLRSALASAAASLPTCEDARATFYPLTRDPDGMRRLTDPRSRGRADEASSEFCEATDPSHPIWRIMDARDTDSKIVNAPDPHCRVDWQTRPYKTFVSIPVKASTVQFGMLSVNAPEVGDLSEQDRIGLIAMARAMAAALALDKKPRHMRKMRDNPNTSTI